MAGAGVTVARPKMQRCLSSVICVSSSQFLPQARNSWLESLAEARFARVPINVEKGHQLTEVSGDSTGCPLLMMLNRGPAGEWGATSREPLVQFSSAYL